jgi:DNA-binding NtrC family response regulator
LPFDFAQKIASARIKPVNYHDQIREHSRKLIMAALTQCRGNRTKAATLLELSRTKFYRLAKMHGLFGDGSETQTREKLNGDESDWM